MSEFFDNMCRTLATPMSRKSAMKLILGGAGALIAAPFALGQGKVKPNGCPNGQTTCTNGSVTNCCTGSQTCCSGTCCPKGTVCGTGGNVGKCCKTDASGNQIC